MKQAYGRIQTFSYTCLSLRSAFNNWIRHLVTEHILLTKITTRNSCLLINNIFRYVKVKVYLTYKHFAVQSMLYCVEEFTYFWHSGKSVKSHILTKSNKI